MGREAVRGATAEETVERVCGPVAQMSRRWLLSAGTDDHGLRLGFASGAQFWVVGRAGVLGSCPAEVAAAAIAFEPLEKVREAWLGVPHGLTHRDVAVHYKNCIAAWGEQELRAVEPAVLDRIDVLGRRVVNAAPGALGALFAGWRELPPPKSLPGRTAVTLHLVREMRGAAHIAAILASGLTPLDAILAAPHAPPRTGPAYAERMGYTGPFRDPAEVRDQRMRAEDLTSAIIAPYLSALTPEERASFGRDVAGVAAAVASPDPR